MREKFKVVEEFSEVLILNTERNIPPKCPVCYSRWNVLVRNDADSPIGYICDDCDSKFEPVSPD